MVKEGAAPGARVGLSGFQPLTADVLALALARHGLRAAPLADPSAEGPVIDAVVAAVDHNTLPRLDELRAALPSVPMVAVTGSLSGSLRQAARRVGVAAVVTRSSGFLTLTDVLRTVLDGNRVAAVDDVHDDPFSELTERELTVLRLVAAGSSNAQIGDALGISPHTARTHVQNLMAKLGVRTRLAAGAVARQAGLTPGGVG